MASNRFDCGGHYRKYDMEGEIRIGTGIVKVHDIFEPTPNFMYDADVVLCDPPYNQSALSSFYTKAEISEKPAFINLVDRFFDVVNEIGPKLLILEIGVPQEGFYRDRLSKEYKNIIVKPAKYYNKGDCLFLFASNGEIPTLFKAMPIMDEEEIIEMTCRDLDFSCICDPMMGTGLVGWYANKYGKKFVGTELNKKRLGLLLESINTGRKYCG